MKRSVFLFISLCCLFGCAAASKTYTPSGEQGFVIDCSGSARNWGYCYQKAGELCREEGYTVLSKSGDTGSVITAGQFGLFGGSIITRSMVVR